MDKIPRRRVLFGALSTPILLGGWNALAAPEELSDLEGRPIQRVANVDDMTSLERHHLITLDMPDEIRYKEPFKVTVNMAEHPMVPEHYIVWMRLFVDRDAISYVTLAPTWQRPEITFTLTLDRGAGLDLIAECNQHGLYGASREFKMLYPGEVSAPDVKPAEGSSESAE